MPHPSPLLRLLPMRIGGNRMLRGWWQEKRDCSNADPPQCGSLHAMTVEVQASLAGLQLQRVKDI